MKEGSLQIKRKRGRGLPDYKQGELVSVSASMLILRRRGRWRNSDAEGRVIFDVGIGRRSRPFDHFLPSFVNAGKEKCERKEWRRRSSSSNKIELN